MKLYFGLGLAMLAGTVIGAGAINGLNAQGKAPGAYAVIEISEVTNADEYKKMGAIGGPAATAGGGAGIVSRPAAG